MQFQFSSRDHLRSPMGIIWFEDHLWLIWGILWGLGIVCGSDSPYTSQEPMIVKASGYMSRIASLNYMLTWSESISRTRKLTRIGHRVYDFLIRVAHQLQFQSCLHYAVNKRFCPSFNFSFTKWFFYCDKARSQDVERVSSHQKSRIFGRTN